jgi:hypothetical protein
LAKRRKLNPNRFQKKPAEQRFFSFDPVRKNLFRWGLVAGAAGGPFLVQPGLVWQIVGFVVIFLISNYHVNRAAQRIPRWHAVFFSLAGAMLAMFVIVTIGSILIAYSQTQ